jgi:hypothetical protein
MTMVFTKYRAIVSYDVTLTKGVCTKIAIFSNFFAGSCCNEIKVLRVPFIMLLWWLALCEYYNSHVFSIQKYVANKYFCKKLNHHIDMTAYNNLIAFNTKFPDILIL